MEPIFALVYTSKASPFFDESEVEDILAVAREKNKQHDLTGFLSFRQGYFCQLLEGPEDEVYACLDKIKVDTRHNSFNLHGQAHVTKRMMPNWSMGRVDFTPGMPSSQSLIELFELAKHGESYANSTSLMTIISMFSRNAKVY